MCYVLILLYFICVFTNLQLTILAVNYSRNSVICHLQFWQNDQGLSCYTIPSPPLPCPLPLHPRHTHTHCTSGKMTRAFYVIPYRHPLFPAPPPPHTHTHTALLPVWAKWPWSFMLHHTVTRSYHCVMLCPNQKTGFVSIPRLCDCHFDFIVHHHFCTDGQFCWLTWQRVDIYIYIYMWEEFINVYLLMTCTDGHSFVDWLDRGLIYIYICEKSL